MTPVVSMPKPTTKETTFSSYTPPPATLSVAKGTLSVPKPVIEPKSVIEPKPISPIQVPSPESGEGQGEVVGPVTQPLKKPVPEINLPQVPAASSATSETQNVPTPTQPNVLAGMVTDRSGTAIESAIVEIIDSVTQIPARALRTNRTGLFQIVTPLKPSSYQVIVEKEGLTFPPVSIVANGKIIQPIIIKAT